MAIAELLGCDQVLWDPEMRWTFNPQHAVLLPPNLQPTTAQKLIPHHPMFDILPWPSLRTKLITTFSLPPEMRHPNARDPMALVFLVQDLEDTEEPCRVDGPNGLSDKDWEIGEVFFKHWWWTLDRSIIENTNKLRQRRGAARLRLQTAPMDRSSNLSISSSRTSNSPEE